MNRFDFNEMTIDRLVSAIIRRIQAIPDLISWHLSNEISMNNKNRLTSFRNKYKDQRCFIMANGPSLGKMDLEPISNEFTIGMNRIYLLFDQIPFQPTFYVCINELVLEQFASDICSLSMPKFLNWNRRKLFNLSDPSTMFVTSRFSLEDQFESNITSPIYTGGTVTFTALQIAYYLGFSEVILIGLDHYFSDKGLPNSIEIRNQEEDTNHFHPDYFPKGIRWQLPDLLRSEIAYQSARTAYESDGRKIMDATFNGKCNVFSKVDYSKLF